MSIRQLLTASSVVDSGLPRRSFLFYSSASIAAGSLWLAGCKQEEEPVPAATPAPAITSFSPGSGAPGTALTLTGSSFTGATSVTVGGVVASFTVVNATTITLLVPAGSQTGAIAVTTPAGSASSSNAFTVLPAAAVVTITGFTPNTGAPGITITLTGTGFTGATAVAVGGVAAVFVVVNATTIAVTVPAAAQTGPLTVTAPAGTTTSSLPFTVVVPLIEVGAGDVGVLNYAYALEQLEAAFYAQVVGGAYFAGASAAERALLSDLRDHEAIHAGLFRTALDAAAIKVLTMDFSAIDFSQRTSVLQAAMAFEDLGVSAYNGVARFITNNDYLLLAGKIVSVEARHAAVIRELLTPNSFVASDVVDTTTTGLERSRRPAAMLAIVNNFLAVGSKLSATSLV